MSIIVTQANTKECILHFTFMQAKHQSLLHRVWTRTTQLFMQNHNVISGKDLLEVR